jgi:hypothetical protein
VSKKNVVYIHNGYYSAIKENEILSFAVKMGGTEGHYVKRKKIQTEKNKCHMFSLIGRG